MSTRRKVTITNPAEAMTEASREGLVRGWAGMAVIAVVLHNTGTFFHDHRLPGIVVATILDAGWVGVSLLLLVAGFFATGLLLDSATSSGFKSGLYAKGLGRTLPLYYVTLLVAFVALPKLLEPGAWTESVASEQFWYWTLLKSWAPSGGAQITGFEHTWVLSIGWPMLLAWPVLLRIGASRAAVFAALVSMAWRAGMLATGTLPSTVFHSGLSWLDAVGVGTLLAVAVRSTDALEWIERWRPVALGGTTLALVAIVLLERGFSAGDGIVVGVGTSVVVLWFGSLIASTWVGRTPADDLLRRLLRMGWVQTLGKHAFAIYLLHFPLHRALAAVLQVGAEPPVADVAVRLAYAVSMLGASTLLAVGLRRASHRGRLLLPGPFAQ